MSKAYLKHIDLLGYEVKDVIKDTKAITSEITFMLNGSIQVFGAKLSDDTRFRSDVVRVKRIQKLTDREPVNTDKLELALKSLGKEISIISEEHAKAMATSVLVSVSGSIDYILEIQGPQKESDTDKTYHVVRTPVVLTTAGDAIVEGPDFINDSMESRGETGATNDKPLGDLHDL